MIDDTDMTNEEFDAAMEESEPVDIVTVPLRRRSLPERLRYLAEKLEGEPSESDVVGVAIGLTLIADELSGEEG